MIKRILSKVPEIASTSLSRARGALPELPSLSLMKPTEIPIYLVHQPGDAEDYVFFFDFEKFMRESQKGLFVRPVLLVWAGRSDFERPAFARALRKSFTSQFARMQDALLDEIEAEQARKKGNGWFDLVAGLELGFALGTGWLQIILLFLAVTTGRAALAEAWSRLTGLFRKSVTPEERLERLHADIEEKKTVVDAALARLEIRLHRDLYTHAFPHGPAGPMAGIDFDAWPLPGHVLDYMDVGKSDSWW